jgi:hypothetical protein
MIVYYDPENGDILFTVDGPELPPVLKGAWLRHEGALGDLSVLCVRDGAIAPHPAATQRIREDRKAARAAAFAAETDPMIGQVLRREITLSAYERAVAEIRHRHPYPEETP